MCVISVVGDAPCPRLIKCTPAPAESDLALGLFIPFRESQHGKLRELSKRIRADAIRVQLLLQKQWSSSMGRVPDGIS